MKPHKSKGESELGSKDEDEVEGDDKDESWDEERL